MSASRTLDPIVYRPIGVVRSPFATLSGSPLQSVAARHARGRVELEPEYAPGLNDLDGFSHLHLITHLHLARPGGMEVVPFLDDRPRGVFATRSPRRPNAIGLSVVRLLAVEGSVLHVEELDLVDGTPVLDLKPFVPAFDNRETELIGWFSGKTDLVHEIRADDRFEP